MTDTPPRPPLRGDELRHPATMATLEVLAELSLERRRQRQTYTDAHDDEHGPWRLTEYAQNYVERARLRGDRSDLVKAAALLVAAIESVDRALAAPAGEQ